MESTCYSVSADSHSGIDGFSTCKHCGHTLEQPFQQHEQNRHQQQQQQYSHRASLRSSSPVGSARRFIMGHRGRMIKLAIMVIFSLMFMGVYVTYFQHPPPDVLLQMNQQMHGQFGSGGDFGASSFSKKQRAHKVVVADPVDRIDAILDGADDDLNDDGDKNVDVDDVVDGRKEKAVVEDAVVKHSKRELIPGGDGKEYWNNFLKVNGLVAIGAVYDKCEGSQIQLGTVVLQEDKEQGGIKARTFVNMTIENEIKGGQFFIEVKYNGKDLYDNYWSLCELEDSLPMENRTFTCPVAAGKYSKVKDKHVPGYLPTGHYQSKAWALDDSENVIACGYSDFKL